MLQLLLTLLLASDEAPVGIRHNQTAPDRADISLKRSPRIVGGRVAEVEEIPYLINIRVGGIFECGGSLVTPKCVVTAAHCVHDARPDELIVRGGVTYLSSLANAKGVDAIYVPKEFSRASLNYDVAVLKLNAKLQADNVATIPLSSSSTLEPGEVVTVSGWGLTSENAINPSNQMRSVAMRVMEHEKCRNLYKEYRNVTDAMFCASLPGRRDACAADSGGPAVVDGQLVGVVSWGKGRECGRVQTPGVYVNIGTVRSWIQRTLNRHCY